MKIGIDGRLWRETGVGRYIRSLVRELSIIDKKNEYVLWLRKKDIDTVIPPNNNWYIKTAEIQWHTINEQIYMPGIYKKENVDLLHIPYFSVPLFTPKPFMVTIHDLTISDLATGKATTKPLPIYALKRIGYNFVLKNAIKQAEKIITVSNTVKQQIIERFQVNPEKIIVTPESGELETADTNNGRDSSLALRMTDKTLKMTDKTFKITNNVPKMTDVPKYYLLYVGNAHPHKNLEKLVKAFQIVRQKIPEMHLVLVGKDDYFYESLSNWIKTTNLNKNIELVSEVDDAKLAKYYENAEAFIFPSLSEGFGIPGLEAMSLGCPVAASDIAVFREIYGEAAFYFNQNDEREMGNKLLKYLKLLKEKTFKQKIVAKGKRQAEKYSWRKMAKETLKIYENCTGL